jgi:hypothetical protein
MTTKRTTVMDGEARAWVNRNKGGNQHAFPLQLVGDFRGCKCCKSAVHLIHYDYRH